MDAAAPTCEKLARAMEAIPEIPPGMVKQAREGHYHDFLSPLDFPEITLVTDLRALASNRHLPRNAQREIRRLAQRVIDGEFDASKEESDTWAASPEGQETFRQLCDDAVFGGMVRDMERRERGEEGGPS